MADLESARPSDEKLLKRAKDGEKAAFEIFYNRHKRRILNYVYRMVSDPEAAKDITQEVFVKAYTNLDGYTAEGKGLHWVYTIAGNTCKNFLRDKKPLASLNKDVKECEGISLQDILPVDEKGPADSVMGEEQQGLIQTHISNLPLKYREVFVLCVMEGYSYEEVAKILKCRVGSVGSRLSRARQILAKGLAKYYKAR